MAPGIPGASTASQKVQYVAVLSVIISTLTLGLSLGNELGLGSFFVLPASIPFLAIFHIVLFRGFKGEGGVVDDILPTVAGGSDGEHQQPVESIPIFTTRRMITAAWALTALWAGCFTIEVIGLIIWNPYTWRSVHKVPPLLEAIFALIEMALLGGIAYLSTRERIRRGRIVLE